MVSKDYWSLSLNMRNILSLGYMKSIPILDSLWIYAHSSLVNLASFKSTHITNVQFLTLTDLDHQGHPMIFMVHEYWSASVSWTIYLQVCMHYF